MESVNVRRGSVDRQGSRKRGRGGALNSSPRDRPIGGVSKPNLSLDISSRQRRLMASSETLWISTPWYHHINPT